LKEGRGIKVAAKSIQQNIRVDFTYRVHFTEDFLAATNPLLAEVLTPPWPGAQATALFVIDQGLMLHHPELIERIKAYTAATPHLKIPCDPLVLTGGEAVKNRLRPVSNLLRAINRSNLDRHAYVVAIGGGAVLDAAGFAAAVAHRGIRLVRVPTTVLAQNDAGIGVKNGINAFGKKNFLGTFSPPCAVINDFTLLDTLDQDEWRSGISEAIKVALLKDPEFFRFLEDSAERLRHRDNDAMRWLIQRCAELHLEHIATCGDPFETGSSRPLDFGHWSAHKLEALSGYRLRHGDAVAIGLALDATYCRLSGMLAEEPWRRIIGVLRNAGFVLFVPELKEKLDTPGHPRSLLHGLEEFREHLGGRLTLMMLTDIGEGIEVNEIDTNVLRQAIQVLEGV
jgi:3-dehydroquinate synthase